MSVQLRVPDGALDRRSTLQSETRLCLALVSAGLSALATLSPAARGAIVTSLDDMVSSGQLGDGQALELLVDLRNRVNGEADPEIAQQRRLEETLFSKALMVSGDAPPPPSSQSAQSTDGDHMVITLR